MSLYKREDSDFWWVNISHPHHPRVRRSTFTADREEAQRIHDQIKAELWNTPKALTGLTWGKAVGAWLSSGTYPARLRSSTRSTSLRPKFLERNSSRPSSSKTAVV